MQYLINLPGCICICAIYTNFGNSILKTSSSVKSSNCNEKFVYTNRGQIDFRFHEKLYPYMLLFFNTFEFDSLLMVFALSSHDFCCIIAA